MALTTGTVTGTFARLGSEQGMPAVGKLIFLPIARRMVDQSADVVYLPLSIVVELDVSGSATVVLAATDNPNMPGLTDWCVNLLIDDLERMVAEFKLPAGTTVVLSDVFTDLPGL